MVEKEKGRSVVALDYQVVGESFWYDGKNRRPLAGPDVVAKWIHNLPGDTVVVTELGGAIDGPVLEIAGRGLEVYYVSTAYEKLARETYGFSGRRRDAEVLYKMFHDPQWQPLFYQHAVDVDAGIINLSDLYATYTGLIADRVALQNRTTATYRRAAWRGRQPGQSIAKYVSQKQADNPVFAVSTEEEEYYLNEVFKAVESLELYQKVLKPIKGIGTRIGAGLIAGVTKASRFFPPGQPKAMLAAKKRIGEYAGLDGDAISADLIVRRRAKGQKDVGKPGLKSDLFLLADQLNRKDDGVLIKQAIDWRKLKELYTILDELLNSPERSGLIFTPKDGGAEAKGVLPKMVAHLRALHKAKEVFFVHYFFPAMCAWEQGTLPAGFDATAQLDVVASEQVARDKKLIPRHLPLRLARLPYKPGPKGGTTAFGDWLTVRVLEDPRLIADAKQLRQWAVEQMLVDTEEEIADITGKLLGKKKRQLNETDGELQAALGRRSQLAEALRQADLQQLKRLERQLVWETRGIGRPICELIEGQTAILRPQVIQLKEEQQRAESPVQAVIDELHKEKDAAELQASELKRELRRAQKAKDAEAIVKAEKVIAEAALPEKIARLRQEIQKQGKALVRIREDFNKKRQKLLDTFRPDLTGALADDPRLKNRSQRDTRYIQTTIWAVIVHRAVKGLWV